MVNTRAQLKKIIQSLSELSYYSGTNYTFFHKKAMYNAFIIFLEKNPEDMMQYLINRKRGLSIQHKIFQIYISNIEKSFPFKYKSNKIEYEINHLLDPKLGIFDGESIFNGKVDKYGNIKNATEEFYIGGRKSYYVQPYYIGKLLDVVSNNKSLINKVQEYSFGKIKLNNVKEGTKTQVKHLRIKPHYQMGGLNYLNKIRKQIVEQIEKENKNE